VHFRRITSIYQPTNGNIISHKTLLKYFKTLYNTPTYCSAGSAMAKFLNILARTGIIYFAKISNTNQTLTNIAPSGHYIINRLKIVGAKRLT